MFGSKRALIRLQIAAWHHRKRETASDRVWYHQKGRRTLPKARAGIGVEKKWSELRRKDCLEGRRRQKSPKEVRAGLGWENQGGGKADRRQAKLEEEARRRKSSHAPHAPRVRFNRRPENCAWPARGCSFGAGAFTKVGDLLQALLLPSLRSIWEKYYEEAHAVVFVIDASCPSRFEDSKSALEKVIRHEDLQGAPLLILANKQVK
ncbi:ADP-ribosylation factor-related protein 1 [Vitis vinifera]|uniref:ADP-ribosylation factor-related protein 1 n=1 Tax=Vitis vinifera TaxID=29760 RepID=A0A438I410_VITVI|nr:ADP-ribosylation factor-related protein 1 [Vitis vinifera]